MRALWSLAFALCPTLAAAQQIAIQDESTGNPSILLCAEDRYFRIGLPRDWTLDKELAADLGVELAFVPNSEVLRQQKVMAYVQVRLKSQAIPNLEAHIADTLQLFTRTLGSATSRAGESFTVRDGLKIDVQLFEYQRDSRPSFEAAAYIEEPFAINYVVLNSRTSQGRDEALSVLLEMFGSYEYFGPKCQVRQ